MCLEVVGRVLEAGGDGLALVEINGAARRISTVLLDLDGVEVHPGDWLQTHTGLAVSVLSADEALAAVRTYEEMRAATAERS